MDGQNFNNDTNQQPIQQTEQPVYQQQPAYQYAQAPVDPNKASGLSIAGLVVGIVSICLFCLSWVGSFIGLVGLVLAVIGQIKKKTKLGMAAIIVSALGLVAGIVMLIVILNAAKNILDGANNYLQYYNY